MNDNNYPAHENVLKRGGCGGMGYNLTIAEFQALKAEFNALLAELAAYKAAVIVLEDGAELEVGDVIKYKGDPEHDSEDYYWGVYEGEIAGMIHTSTSLFSNMRGFKKVFVGITERNNLPVIYSSALNGKGGVA